MTNSKKSLATIKIVDVFGNPIAKAQYQVKNQKTRGVIAAGATNSAGCIVEISRDKGTVLDVYVKSMFNGMMLKVQTFTMSKDRMLVKIASPKVLLDLQTLQSQGANGQYKRKTHTVKKGETLTSIASQNHTTVRALELLNKIDDPDKISVGQVIKLPVNIPATGSNAHHDKPKIKPKSKLSTPPKPKTAPTAKSKTSQASTGILGTITGISGKVANTASEGAEELNKVYEEKKKALGEIVGSVKIPTLGDRSQDSGTPKTNVTNLCKTSPQCIDKGNSELIREVNIRLAGFGGALPTDEFTELTAKCIRQFQQDYMGVQPTGKICGSVLMALDKFYNEYSIKDFVAKIRCPCGSCSGYGNNIRGKKSGLNIANEYPGIHRSLIGILKALNFYLKNEFKEKKMDVAYIESGYRCTVRNVQQDRTTVNHMGLALDIHFNKNGKRTRELSDMEFIRKKVIAVKMSGTEDRTANNKIYLEPKVFNNGDEGAVSWVHFDLTKLSSQFFKDNFFKKTIEDLNGVKLVSLTQSLNQSQILQCSGVIPSATPTMMANSSIEDLVKQLGDAISSGEGSYEAWNAGAPLGSRVKYGKMTDVAGTITGKTINQLLVLSKTYKWTDSRRRFATGKYQTIPKTLKKARDTLGLTGNELYDASMQEKVFREYLLSNRKAINDLIQTGNASVDEAMVAASKEWASIGLPKGEVMGNGKISDGVKGYHESATNKANPKSTAKVRAIFEKIKAIHQAKK